MNSTHQLEGLIRMANQIAENLHAGSSDESETAEQVANHIRRFWARSMKAQIEEYVQANGTALDSVARLAITRLLNRAPSVPTSSTGETVMQTQLI